jgi:hypothetical protein
MYVITLYRNSNFKEVVAYVINARFLSCRCVAYVILITNN